MCDGTPLLGRYVSPCIIDWNNDGLLDLIVGYSSWDNTIERDKPENTIFINKGTKEQYLFEDGDTLKTKSGTKIIASRNRTQFRVADLDKDGKKDLIMCGWDNVVTSEPWYYYRNIGSDNSPELAEAVTFKHKDNSVLYAGEVYCNARFDLWDWNNDGFLDLIYADYDNFNTQYNPVRFCLAEPFGVGIKLNKQKNGTGNIISILGNNLLIGPLNKTATVAIYNFNGRRVITQKIQSGTSKSKISLCRLAKGQYVGILKEMGGKSQRFVIPVVNGLHIK